VRYAFCLTFGLTSFGIGAITLWVAHDAWFSVLLFPWAMILGLALLLLRRPGSEDF
jgi:glucose-6-phosphate-specific signal transduction histidine kinase